MKTLHCLCLYRGATASPHQRVVGATLPSITSQFTRSWSDSGALSVEQLKRWALEGFDRPGFCFYVSEFSLTHAQAHSFHFTG